MKNRTDKSRGVATARVHVVVSDHSVRMIRLLAFGGCRHLVKVTAPFVKEVGESAFAGGINLRHAVFSPILVIKPTAFVFYLSLEVLVASVGFELDKKAELAACLADLRGD